MSAKIPSVTLTRVLIVALALLAAGIAMWRVSTTTPAPETPYFPPGHMQITANTRPAETEPQPDTKASELKAPEPAAPANSPPQEANKTAEQTPVPIAAVPAPMPSAAPSAPKPPTTAAISVTDVERALAEWKLAWESRDVPRYLGFYHPDFPDLRVFSRQKNGVMVRAKNISVGVDQTEISPLPEDRVRVRFLQSYRSDTYESQDFKTQIWVSSPDGPKIIEEFTRAANGG